MLQRAIITAASVLALTATANAADLGSYKGSPASYASVNWSGLYFGANVGGAWATDKVTDSKADWCPSSAPCSYNNDPSAVLGGGQIGFNFQRGNLVFGSEVDLGYMGLSKTVGEPGYTTVAHTTVGSGVYADVTGRLGYAIDRALVYGKAGYAYYGGELSNYSKDGSEIGTASTSGLSGWTAGAGIEYKISPAWSVKAEYQHFDFGSITNNVPDTYCASGSCPFKNELTIETVKVGVNYFVGGGYDPLK